MSETLAAFIYKRLQELSVREAEVRATLDEIHAERDQLRKAALAAGVETDAPPEQTATPKAGETQQRRSPSIIRKLPSITLKQAVLLVLFNSNGPMLALDILSAVNERFNADFPRTSLSPQLSRLKDEELLRLNGREWDLTEKGTAAAANLEAQPDIFG